MLLGAHPAIFMAGELKSLSREKPADRRRKTIEEWACTCGAPNMRACYFWQEINARMSETLGATIWTEVDLYHPDDEVFGSHNHALFEAIANVSGTRLIVDTSKSLPRLRRLAATGCFDIRPVHLLRHGLGYVHSQKRGDRDWLFSAREHVATTMKRRRLLATVPHHRVAYEALARWPKRTVRRILEPLGLSWHPAQRNWASAEHHVFAGNRMRYSRSSAIVLDRAWKTGLSRWEKLCTRWIGLPTRVPGTWLYDLWPALWRLEPPAQPRAWTVLGAGKAGS